MPTVLRYNRLTDLLPPPSLAFVIAALVAGAVFASVVFTVDHGSTFSRQSASVEEPETLQQQHQRTERLLRAIEREVSAERSAAPVVTLPRVAQQPAPRVTRTPRLAATAPATGLWSRQAEAAREEWRRWYAARMRE